MPTLAGTRLCSKQVRTAPILIQSGMFVLTLRVSCDGTPVPLRWLDSFAMRNFTNDAAFDDTLPRADGLLEVGLQVPLEELHTAMETWFRSKGWLTAKESLSVELCPSSAAPAS